MGWGKVRPWPWLYIWSYMGQKSMRKHVIYVGKIKSYSWVGLLGQPLARRTGQAGRTGYMELGQPKLGRPHEKCTFLGNILMVGPFLAHFWPFLDLLDLKHGSGSKFYTGKLYRQVWNSKLLYFVTLFPASGVPHTFSKQVMIYNYLESCHINMVL